MNPPEEEGEETLAERISILVVDDHALFRYGLRAMLASVAGFEVVGEANTGEEAVALAAELTPDVVLMDIQMPDLNGIEATQRIVQASPGVGVIVLTMFEEDGSVIAAMRAGARGYVLKGADAEEVVKIVRSVAGGEARFGPDIARRLTGFFSPPEPGGIPSEAFAELSAREREILDLIARGRADKQIARHLSLSHKTVRNHVTHIFAKLGISGRAQAIIRARQAGLGREEDA